MSHSKGLVDVTNIERSRFTRMSNDLMRANLSLSWRKLQRNQLEYCQYLNWSASSQLLPAEGAIAKAICTASFRYIPDSLRQSCTPSC